MPMDALSALCAQLTRDLLTIAKFLFLHISSKLRETNPSSSSDVTYSSGIRRVIFSAHAR